MILIEDRIFKNVCGCHKRASSVPVVVLVVGDVDGGGVVAVDEVGGAPVMTSEAVGCRGRPRGLRGVVRPGQHADPVMVLHRTAVQN